MKCPEKYLRSHFISISLKTKSVKLLFCHLFKETVAKAEKNLRQYIVIEAVITQTPCMRAEEIAV